MKKYFFTGLITLLPIAITLFLIIWVFNLFTAPFTGVIESLMLSYEKKMGRSPENHDILLFFLSRILSITFLLTLIFTLGFFCKKFFMSLFLRLTDSLFSRIPFVRIIYRLSLDITKAIFEGNTKMFKETVLIPFPHHDSLAVGFTTGPVPDIFKEKTQTELAIFVPTAPHPMSGFVLLAPKKIVIPVDVSIEDAFKFLISCGSMPPGEEMKTEHEKSS